MSFLFTEIVSLQEDIDLVPSDVVAAVILLQEKQSQPVEGATGGCEVKGQTAPQEWMNISHMEHYMKYACAAYGYPLYALMHPILGAWTLFFQNR